MTSPHIAVCCTAHPPGDIRIYSRWVMGLNAAGWKVSLIAPEISPIPTMPDHSEYFPIPVVKKYISRILKAKRVLPILNQLKPDVVLYPDPELHNVMLGFRRNSGAVVLFDRHENFNDAATLYQRGGFVSRLIARAYSINEKYAAVRLDGVIVVLESMVKQLPQATNTIVAHNFPSRRVLQSLGEDPIPGTPSYTAINIGAVQFTRGYHYLLETVRKMVIERGRTDFTFCLGGQWDPDAYGLASEYVKQNDLEANVHLIPNRIDHTDVVNLYRAAKIGFSPYIDNPKARNQLQNKVLEYMGAGLPVITSPSSLNAQIVREAECGMLHWANELDDIADSLEKLMDDEELRVSMGQRGREYALKNLVWETELERAMSWIEVLLHSRSKPS